MRVTFVLGTRPEVIKLAPVIQSALERGVHVSVVHTGQHLKLTEPLMRFFRIESRVHSFINLEAMLEKPSLTGLSARVLERLDAEPKLKDTDWIVVQGDTTSAFIGAYWAFCHKIPIAHVEAGLRTGNLQAPFPEEANRLLVARLADVHFAPTPRAMQTLIDEGVSPTRIFMTGNTSIDALKYTLARIESGDIPEEEKLPAHLQRFIDGHRVVLVTTHRRENIGEPLSRICRGLRSICEANPNIRMVVPVHPNPAVTSQVQGELGQHPQILLCEPLSYIPFVELMSRSDLLITDSGGVQEEGPTLRKPILVVRESTERPEGVEAGFAQLIGSCPNRLFEAAERALARGRMPERENPFGDGRAAARIAASLAFGHGVQAPDVDSLTGQTSIVAAPKISSRFPDLVLENQRRH